MRENQLQHEIVKWFSQTHPNLYGCLYAVDSHNESEKSVYMRIIRNNPKQADRLKALLPQLKFSSKMQMLSYRRSLGHISGLSDIELKYNSIFADIELKIQGSRHPSDHIRQQLEIGDIRIREGGYFIMSYDIDDLKAFISGIIQNNFSRVTSLQEKWFNYVQEKLNKGTKTIKFD